MSLQFYIELQNSEPLIWRRIVLPLNYSFYKLHMAIQGAFGWENCHLYQFSTIGLEDQICYGEPDFDEDDHVTRDAHRTKLQRVFKKSGEVYTYVYDFGDYWKHTILLESIIDKERDGPWHVGCNEH